MKHARRVRNWFYSAMSTMDYLCGDCGTTAYQVEWDDGDRPIVHIFHLRECVVLRNAVMADVAEEFLRGQLWQRGYATGQYREDDLARHTAL